MNATTDAVTHDRDGDVAVIRFDDGKANALTHTSIDALNAALDVAEREAAAVVLAGRPGRFCAGFDLAVMQGGPPASLDLLEAGARLAVRIYRCPVPVVIACTGHAVAMGAILLMAADTRIGAAGSFRIGLNEVAIGMPVPRFAVEIARDRLDKRHFVPAVQHAQLYDPDGAVSAGFLDWVVEGGEDAAAVVTAARDHAAELAANLRPAAFTITREIMRGEVADHLEEVLTRDLTSFRVEPDPAG